MMYKVVIEADIEARDEETVLAVASSHLPRIDLYGSWEQEGKYKLRVLRVLSIDKVENEKSDEGGTF